MPRDTTVRQRVIDYLAGRGPVEDRSGRATSRLKDAVGYQGGDAGFIRIVSLMAESGDIVRDVRGKRTYRIAVSEEAATRAASSLASAPPAATPTSEVDRPLAALNLGRVVGDGPLDYDQLAGALLSRVAHTLSASEGDGRANGDGAGWARRRIDQLETKITTLQRELARSRAEVQAVSEQRDEIQGLYDAATRNIEVFSEQKRGRSSPPPDRAAAGLDSEDQALLYRLRRPTEARGSRQSASPTSIG